MPDVINGAFECLGAVAVAFSIARTLRDKQVHGVSWLTIAFFTVWGVWNLWYYPHLGQWVSWLGSAALVVTNAFWVGLLIYFSRYAR